MDTSRKANRESHETTLQYKSRQEAQLVEDLHADKLTQLLEFVSRLQRTPPGSEELQRRNKLFGECKRIADETSGQFYARLRHWLDRDLPQTRSPRHAPRQTSD